MKIVFTFAKKNNNMKSKLLLAQQYNRLLPNEKPKFHRETGVAQHEYYRRIKNVRLFSHLELAQITTWINKKFNTNFSADQLIQKAK